MSTTQANILLIMTDQQRYDSLGCYGVNGVQTPNLDRLAEEGVLFENCYATNPICTPSRASLFTGKHLPGHGVYKLHDILPEGEVLFTKRLQEVGYKTALFGKLHVSGRIYEAAQRHPNDGFDIYEWCLEASIHMDSPFNGYSQWLQEKHPEFYRELKEKGRNLLYIPREYHFTHWTAERTIDFIKNHHGKQPFFCMMSIFDPHNPYEDYPLEMRDLVDEHNIPDPLINQDMGSARPYGVRQEEHHSYLGSFHKFTVEDFRKMRLGYFASIALLDLEVGRILEALEEKGLAENTIVIFTSDHGDMLGDHNLLVKGAFFYDPCVKVPLIIRWPKKCRALSKVPGTSGTRISQLVQLHDLATTILTAAGVSQEKLQKIMPESQNLADLVNGEKAQAHEFVICCYRNTGINDQGVYWDPAIHATMIRDEHSKLNVYHADPPSKLKMQGELYDMVEDKNELNNLWEHPAYKDVRRHLTEKLLEWIFSQELQSGSRGGEAVPDRSQRLVNALK